MSNYYWHSKLDYIDYLQAKSFEDSLRGEIRSSTDSLIAASERLQHRQLSVASATSADLTRQLGSLSTDIQRVEHRLGKLNSTFHWGFSEMLMEIGGVAASLEQLLHIAKNLSKNWAYEQFNDARDCYRRELFPEALERVNWAINGYSNNMGYAVEYRFHYCLGILRIGSFENKAPEIVDLGEAKKAFLNAARYAVHDEPQEAANAYVCAGRASLYQGQKEDARTYSEKACQLDPSMPEAFFQLAKVLMCQGEGEMGIEQLRTALRLDSGYESVVRADEDFQRHREPVEALLAVFTTEAKKNYEHQFIDFTREIRALEEFAARNPRFREVPGLEKGLRILSDARTLGATGTYNGYSVAAAIMEAGRWNVDIKRLSADLQWLAWRIQRDAELAQVRILDEFFR